MKPILFISFLIYLGLATSLPLSAQEEIPPGKFSLAVNPSYFVLGGYYFNPTYSFPKRWTVGATYQGGFELPDFARDQFFTVSDEAITVDWSYAVGVDVRYRFTDAAYDKGFFAAAAVGYEAWEATNAPAASDSFSNWFTSVGLGYNWYPTKNQRLHLGIQYNLIFIMNNTDQRSLGEDTYNIEPIVPPGLTPIVIIGWRL